MDISYVVQSSIKEDRKTKLKRKGQTSLSLSQAESQKILKDKQYIASQKQLEISSIPINLSAQQTIPQDKLNGQSSKSNYIIYFVMKKQKLHNLDDKYLVLFIKEIQFSLDQKISQIIKTLAHIFKQPVYDKYNLSYDINQVSENFSLYLARKNGFPKTSYPSLDPKESISILSKDCNKLSLLFNNGSRKTLEPQYNMTALNKQDSEMGYYSKRIGYQDGIINQEQYIRRKYSSGIESLKQLNSQRSQQQNCHDFGINGHNYIYKQNTSYVEGTQESTLQLNDDSTIYNLNNSDQDQQDVQNTSQNGKNQNQYHKRRESTSKFWDFFGCCGTNQGLSSSNTISEVRIYQSHNKNQTKDADISITHSLQQQKF